MKKLVCKLLLLMGLLACIFGVIEFLSFREETKLLIARLTNSEDYIKEGSGTSSICPVIRKVSTENETTVLVIGDSIAGQMFNSLGEEDPRLCIACTNAAIDITGQYMLAKAWLDSHPNGTDVWLYMHPLTITRTFDLELGYGYAVMPFAKMGLLKELDANTIRQMSSVYSRPALSKIAVEWIDDSPVNRKLFLNWMRLNRKEYCQDNDYEISSQYILKLSELCKERGVEFHFAPTPSTEYFRDRIEDTREDFLGSDLAVVYPDYLDRIYYFPTEWSEDMTHFAGEHATREVYDEVIGKAYDEFFLWNLTK